MSTEPRRLRIASVPREVWLTIFNSIAHQEIIQLPILEELPEGTILVDVFDDVVRGCMAFIVEHPSFDEVPFGQEIPRHCGYLEVTAFRRIPLRLTHSQTIDETECVE